MEDIEDFADLEVDSVVHLIVPVADEMLDAELAGMQGLFGGMMGSGVVPLSEMETRAPVEADARHQVSPQGYRLRPMLGIGSLPQQAT